LLLFITNFLACFCPHRLGRNREGQYRVLCYQYGGKSESGLGPPGSAANWRCIALEKLSGSNCWTGLGCIVDPDIDADDYPERDPQQGQ